MKLTAEQSNAFKFAESVMFSKFRDELVDYTQPTSPQDALRQLKRNAVDMSERMAIEKLEAAGVTL